MIKKNDMSYWLPRIQVCNFNIPETLIIKLSKKQGEWLESDHYEEKDIKKLGNFINKKIEKSSLNKKNKLFMKTGNFSDKFHFNDSCCVINREKIGEQFLNMFYYGMLVGCESSFEVIIRKFIETNYNRESIYNGMKLNTEFRIFYDFTNNEFLGCFNYWDTKVMLEHLKGKDLEKFNKSSELLEKDFNEHKKELIKLIKEKCPISKLIGTWSLDFLWGWWKILAD